MNRRVFLKGVGSASLLGLCRRGMLANSTIRRVRPSDPGWPSEEAWKRLNDVVGGSLIRVDFPLNACISSPQGAECRTLFANLKNPYYTATTPE